MELYNLNTSSKKEVKAAKSTDKKAINAVLTNGAKMLEAAFSAIVKDNDKRARNIANNAKGRYQSAVAIVANCWPYQTEAGELAKKATTKDGRKVWAVKELTAVSARGLLRDSLKNFIDGNGRPVVTHVVIGAEIPAKVKKS